MRSISALAVILASVLLLSADQLEPSFTPSITDIPSLIVTELGRLDIPGDDNDITLMVYNGDHFYLGAPGPNGSLYCYSLPDYEHQWTTSLGQYHDTSRQRFLHEATPYTAAFSADGGIIFVGVSAENTPNPHEDKLAAIDTATGSILSETQSEDTYTLHVTNLGGTPVVIAVGHGGFRVLRQDDLDNELFSYVQELEPRAPAPDDQAGRPRFPIGRSVYDSDTRCLYCTLPDAGEIARFQFSGETGQVTVDKVTRQVSFNPFRIVQAGDELAITGIDSRELRFFDRRTLEQTGVMRYLRYGSMTVHSGLIYVVGEETFEGPVDPALQVIDPLLGEVFFLVMPDASLHDPVALGKDHIALINSGHLTDWEAVQSKGQTTYKLVHTIVDGQLLILDIQTWQFTVKANFPDGCAQTCFNGDTGEFIMAQYNQSPEGTYLQDELRIMRIELP